MTTTMSSSVILNIKGEIKKNKKLSVDICQRSTSLYSIRTHAAVTRAVKTTLFIDFSLRLIYTNKVLFRVNILHQTLQAISILCPTIVRLKFNQCKLHVTSLIFLHRTIETIAVEASHSYCFGQRNDHAAVYSVLFSFSA